MSSQVEVKRSDNPIIECPNCGDDGNNYSYDEDGNEYPTRSSHIGYCPRCKAYTEFYHCHEYISEDDQGDECNTEWCSVCGYAPHAPNICPDCYSTDKFIQSGEPYIDGISCPIHEAPDGDYIEGWATYYTCNNCGQPRKIGLIRCDCMGSGEEGGEEGGDTTPHYCPQCQNSPLSGNHGEGICATCGNVDLAVCSECGTTYCSKCGKDTPVLQCECGNTEWNPEKRQTDMTCDNCKLDNTSVYVCSNCTSWYCTNCGHKIA